MFNILLNNSVHIVIFVNEMKGVMAVRKQIVKQLKIQRKKRSPSFSIVKIKTKNKKIYIKIDY